MGKDWMTKLERQFLDFRRWEAIFQRDVFPRCTRLYLATRSHSTATTPRMAPLMTAVLLLMGFEHHYLHHWLNLERKTGEATAQ